MFTSAKRRATNILNHFTNPPRTFTTTPPTMAPLTINSTVRMNSGYEIPLLGFGVYQTPMDVAEQVTAHAVKSGYRHADSAAAYRKLPQLPVSSAPNSLAQTSSLPPKYHLKLSAMKPLKLLLMNR
jgi:hypothetical protein